MQNLATQTMTDSSEVIRLQNVQRRYEMGMTPGNTLLQFLVESTTLCLFGGLLGLALGAPTAALVARVTDNRRVSRRGRSP